MVDNFDKKWQQLLEGNSEPLKKQQQQHLGSFDEYLEFCLKYEPELLTAFRNKGQAPGKYAEIRDSALTRIKAEYEAAEGETWDPEPAPAVKVEPAGMSDLEFQRQWSIIRGKA